MSAFAASLRAWAANRLRQLRGDGRDILRLLRGGEAGRLFARAPRDGLPAESLRSGPGGARGVEIPPGAHRWVCWPSSDSAVHGWGDPYLSLPLGTIQTSFSDTARIGRSIGEGNQVQHGVNDVGGHRDWRSPSGALVLSWTASELCNDGSVLRTSSGFVAAAIRDGATSDLLWVDESYSPIRLFSQECVIENEGITGLVGEPVYAVLDPMQTTNLLMQWIEFSGAGGKIVVTTGGSAETKQAFEFVVPGAFSGQTISGVEVAASEVETITWESSTSYDGTGKYLMKAQYRGEVLSFVWAEIKIRESRFISNDEVFPLEKGKYVCSESQCSVGFPAEVGVLPGEYYQKSTGTQSFVVTLQVLRDDISVFGPEEIVNDGSVRVTWGKVPPTWKDPEGLQLDFKGLIPTPPGLDGPWPCGDDQFGDFCNPKPGADVSDTRTGLFRYRFIPSASFDARHDRCSLIDLGWAGADQAEHTGRLRLELRRPGEMAQADERPGKHGIVALTELGDIRDETDLVSELRLLGRRLAPDGEQVNVVGGSIVSWALDVDAGKALACVRGAKSEVGGSSYVSVLEGAEILGLLSIQGEPNARIVQEDERRIFSLMRKKVA